MFELSLLTVDPHPDCAKRCRCIQDRVGFKKTKSSKIQMKLVVPNTSAGMVIGKSGARIKEIREQTGANIQVYPKAGSQEAKVSQERIITIAAEQDEVLMDALQRVLEKVAADPQHAMATVPDHKDDNFGPASGLLHGIGGGVQGQTIQPFDFSNRSQNAPQFGGAPTVQQNHFGQISHAAAQVWQPNQQRALGEIWWTDNDDSRTVKRGRLWKSGWKSCCRFF